MNELQKIIASIPEDARTVASVSIRLDPLGGISVYESGAEPAKVIFSLMFDTDTLTEIKNCLLGSIDNVTQILAKNQNVGPIINVSELQKQAGEKSS